MHIKVTCEIFSMKFHVRINGQESRSLQSMAVLSEKMPSISLKVVLLNYAMVILLASSGTTLDFKETILNLEEGSTLNYSTGVESSESLQSIYVCITKNPSAIYENFDHNTSLSSGDCVDCDNRQSCTHQFNSSAINVTILNQLQNDSIQSYYVVTLFKENISFDDDGTKIICGYEDDNTTVTVPCSWIYLNVHFLPKPENPINILVPVAVSSSTVIVLLIILLIVVIFTVVIIRKRKRVAQTQALVLASRSASSQVHSHIFNVTRREESNREEWIEKIREPRQHATHLAYLGDKDRSRCSSERVPRGIYYGSLRPPSPVPPLLDHSDELISIDIDWPDPQTRADEESSSETKASGVRPNKVPDLPDHISSRDEGKK